MSFIEFFYNRSVYSTTDYSLLEVFYSFNYLTHLDLFPLPIDEMISLNDNRKSHVVKAIHKNVWKNIKTKINNMHSKLIKGEMRFSF